MATDISVKNAIPAANDRASLHEYSRLVQKSLSGLASLQLTVVLFALAVFLVFAGTLAQAELGMWDVMRRYFTAWITWIDFRVLFPLSFFPNRPDMVLRLGNLQIQSFPYPGGATIGSLMAINLLSAHLIRFRVQARGMRLFVGVMMLGLGAAVTAIVVLSGNNMDGLQGQPLLSYSALWRVMLAMLGLIWLGLAAAFVMVDKSKTMQMWGLGAGAAVLGLLLAWIFFTGFELSPSSMRILWQLVQGEVSAAVLLVGCVMLFKKRSGIVLLHMGVALLMLGGVLTANFAVEEKMRIGEGETVNFTRDIRSVELALVDRRDPLHEKNIIVPQSQFLNARGAVRREKISSSELPVDLQLEQYLPNAALRDVKPEDQNPATTGEGMTTIAEQVSISAGADANAAVDLPAAYVTAFNKQTGERLGTFLLSALLAEDEHAEKLRVDGVVYDAYLRFRRTYKPYEFTLLDVSKEDYMGTSTPRDYSSYVRLEDDSRQEDREVRIWMNNPLRYAGETFYQANYFATPQGEFTELQVVRNSGWMIPYVACMIVATGMFVQFGLTLMRYLGRRFSDGPPAGSSEREGPPAGEVPPPRKPARRKRKSRSQEEPADLQPGWLSRSNNSNWSGVVWPLLVAAAAIFAALYVALPKSSSRQGFDFQRAGALPIMYEGRVKPLDTLARNSLRIMSNRDYFYDQEKEKQPAIRWLLDVICERPEAQEHQVFRIDNMEVQSLLGLPRREGHRYSVQEMRPKLDEFLREVQKAAALEPKKLDTYQKKLMELDRRLRQYMMLVTAFQLPVPPQGAEAGNEQARMLQFMREVQMRIESLQRQPSPLSIPTAPATEGEPTRWLSYPEGWLASMVGNVRGETPSPAASSWTKLMKDYYDGKVDQFNAEVVNYQRFLGDSPPTQLNPSKIKVETFLNRANPFGFAASLYLLATLLAVVSWMGYRGPLGRSALALIVVALVIHTAALAMRVYVSGRPPVTNLYSSAVFIGWGLVLMGVFMELMTGLSVGNVVAGLTGWVTLMIAYFLAADGDTFTVLVAVLDTQFWLTTHVLCVALGYAATFGAGAFALVYLFGGMLRLLSAPVAKELERLIYGVVCFAMFLSFVGTVLGGLWADDSWGRFWGWDPKENGALMIVLWNALLLHARWGKMIAGRGLAMLAVAGNIVTAWSWFGTNELGIGLHSYGFTEGRLLYLGLFVLFNLLVLAGSWMYFPVRPAGNAVPGRLSGA